jgi:hypothetical protein
MAMIPEREELASRVEVTLKEYMDEKFRAMREALMLATKDMDRRLLEMNKFREENLQDRNQLVTRTLHDRLQADVDIVRNRVTVIETRIITWVTSVGLFLTLVQIMGGFALYFILHK